MPFIVVKGEKLLLDNLRFNEDESTFELHSSADHTGNILTFDYLLTPWQDYQPKDYTLYIFYKNHFPENNIFQVYEKELDKRIGWIFPLQSLLSKDHDYVDNEYFLRYAFVAFQKLLTNENNRSELSVETNSLEKLYDGASTIVLILSNQTLPHDFQLSCYLPALFKYGYYFKDVKDFHSITESPRGKKVHLQKIASPLHQEDYLTELFETLIYDQHLLVKFHLLYQVIELLIEKVLHHELKTVSNQLEQKKIYTRDLSNQIQKFLPEVERIKKLFSDYEKSLDTGDLQNCCDCLLNALGKAEQTKQEIAKSLYAVRNFIVHDYRSLPKSQIETLEKINSHFEILIIDMLFNFNFPS